MAQSAQIQKMSTRHEAIMNYILANPTTSYGQVAGAFGVTAAWLSTIVHSAAFQNQLKRRHDEIFDVAVLSELDEKLTAAAHLSLDRYLEKIPVMDADQIINGTDKILSKLGFGTKTTPGMTIHGNVNIQQNRVDPAVLAEARSRIGKADMGQSDLGAALLYQTTTERFEAEGVVVRIEGP